MQKRQNTSNSLIAYNKRKKFLKNTFQDDYGRILTQELIGHQVNAEVDYLNFNQEVVDEIEGEEDIAKQEIEGEEDINQVNFQDVEDYILNFNQEGDVEDKKIEDVIKQEIIYQQDDEEEINNLTGIYQQLDFLEKVNPNEDVDNDEDIDRNDHKVERYQPANFSIVEESLQMVNDMQGYKYPSDNFTPLQMGNEFLKGDFARATNDFIKRFGVPPKQEADLFYLLRKYLVGFNLPINFTKAKKKYVSALNDYSEPLTTFKRYDICIRGCCVFVAENKDADKCPICNAYRYRINKSNNNNHINNTIKTAFKQLNYRPIIPLFYFLLSQPGFIIAINYEYKYGDEYTHSTYKYTDVSQGRNYQHHLQEMNYNFREKYNQSTEIINVPLLLSEFYDGVMTTKKV
jgi:hypothetical protein